MRNWLAASAALTLAYDVALLAILIRDGDRAPLISSIYPISVVSISFSFCCRFSLGKSNKQKDYNVHGTQAEKVFNALGAVAAILVCNTSGLLPEIQVRIALFY